VILHICDRATLEAARADGWLRPAGFAEIGFVHCSDPGTVHLPASALYAGRDDLVLLEVDPARLADHGVAVRWEPGQRDGRTEDPTGPWFPHVYGPLPLAAVVAEHPWRPEPDGTFRPPPALRER
jgi:uncharacterized protein (DUF952 family)